MIHGAARAEPAQASGESEARTPFVRSALELAGSQVVLGRIRLGFVRDILLGADLGVVLGLVVETEAGRRCFLPWAGAHVADGRVDVASPSLLLGEVELDYYLSSGIRLLELTDADIELDEPRGVVRDVTVNRDGRVAELVVETRGGRKRKVRVGDVRVRWSAGRLAEVCSAASRRRRRRVNGRLDVVVAAAHGRGA